MSKRIFITGGAKGIGKAVVQAFSKENNVFNYDKIEITDTGIGLEDSEFEKDEIHPLLIIGGRSEFCVS